MSRSTRIRRAAILAAGVAATGLALSAVAGPAQAAPVNPAPPSTMNAGDIVNLGLTIREAQAVQGFLKARYSYSGAINGQLDTASWKAMQRELTAFGSHDDVGVCTGPIDGIVDIATISALQQLPAPPIAGYTGPIDGVDNQRTEAAFRVYADTLIEDDGL